MIPEMVGTDTTSPSLSSTKGSVEHGGENECSDARPKRTRFLDAGQFDPLGVSGPVSMAGGSTRVGSPI